MGRVPRLGGGGVSELSYGRTIDTLLRASMARRGGSISSIVQGGVRRVHGVGLRSGCEGLLLGRMKFSSLTFTSLFYALRCCFGVPFSSRLLVRGGVVAVKSLVSFMSRRIERRGRGGE